MINKKRLALPSVYHQLTPLGIWRSNRTSQTWFTPSRSSSQFFIPLNAPILSQREVGLPQRARTQERYALNKCHRSPIHCLRHHFLRHTKTEVLVGDHELVAIHPPLQLIQRARGMDGDKL